MRRAGRGREGGSRLGEGGGPDLGEGEADLVVGGVFGEAVAAELEGGGVGEEGVGEGGG